MTKPLKWGVLGSRSNIWNGALRPAMEASDICEIGSLGSRGGTVSYEDVLADASVEAVYIPLPNGMHREWAERCAAAGKHVLCEKPLAPTADDAAAMADACAAAGVILAEAYFAPFHPRAARLMQMAQDGDLGELRSLRAHFSFNKPDLEDYRWNPDQGGGSLLDVGIYCIEPMLAASGRRAEDVGAVSATAHRTDRGVDAVFHAWLDLGDGL
ncbi:MAG TPA: Gfo/Idh/MocA family oxidoreductase, partial [Acidimicrobiales bacterium]